MNAKLVIQILCGTTMLATPVTSAFAACVKPPASEQAIINFKLAPQKLVHSNADTRSIESTVRDLVATDASLAPLFIVVAKSTIPRFQKAIAAGLAQAAIACATADQNAVLLIQSAAASFADEGFQAMFAAVAGDLSTVAAPAAADFATGSSGSVVGVSPGTTRRTTGSGGGGGTSPAPRITAPALSLLSAPAMNPSSTTAAAPVSATR